jgi:glutathione peroxidase-family protein
MGSQSTNIKTHMEIIKKYNQQDINVIAIPFDNNGSEPGDDYEVVAHYENILGIKSYVTEKINSSHRFFKDFGEPTTDFTEYHFDNKTKFVRKT